jgi:tetratricopeptide (TPR) repeat protein
MLALALSPAMTGYTTREVAEVLGISTAQVRTFARGLLEPRRGTGGELRFSFQDIVLLRTARELRERNLSPRRIRAALSHLRDQLPEGRPLSAVAIAASGDHVVVRDQDTVWEPETGQVTFDFSVRELATKVEPFAGRLVSEHAEAEEELDADGWYDLGWELEAVSLSDASAAYARALELRPEHVEARVNRGRLLHEAGDLATAEAEYRRALEEAPDSALATFNLGVALEDQNRLNEAARAYETAVELDEELAEAHFNLARLRERSGDARAALRHLSEYRRLTGGGRSSSPER